MTLAKTLAALAAFLILIPSCFAKDETLAELKGRISENLTSSKFGDVKIILPASGEKSAFAIYAQYVFPNFDRAEFLKIIGNGGNAKPPDSVCAAFAEYCARRGLEFGETAFAPDAARYYLSCGMPLAAHALLSPADIEKFTERAEKRKSAANAGAWRGMLEKNKISVSGNGSGVWLIISGFNKFTGEFMLRGADAEKAFWITREEMESLPAKRFFTVLLAPSKKAKKSGEANSLKEATDNFFASPEIKKSEIGAEPQ